MNFASDLHSPIFRTVGAIADARGQRAFAIGGFTRDLLLRRSCKDIDIVTEGSGIELAEAAAKELRAGRVSVFRNFGTAMFKWKDFEVEFVGARKESYDRGSRKPVVENGTLEDDQRRRDFTVNALALSLNRETYGDLIDPFGGLADLRAGRLRTPLDPDITYSDDPLRMMRAVRFATQLGFTLVPDNLASIRKNAERLDIVSMERVSGELQKIMLARRPSEGFMLLLKTDLLQRILPEVVALKGVEWRNGVGHKDNFYHTLEVLDRVAETSDDVWLRWAALLHDIAKPPTKRFVQGIGWTFHGHEDRGARMVPKIFGRLKLPLDAKMKYVQKLVALHLRPIALTKEEISDSAIRRLLFDAGDEIDDLMVLCRADITSKNEAKVKRYLANYDQVLIKLREVEEKDHLRNFQPPVSGEEIMEIFGIPPSRPVGEIKNAIKDAILDGVIPNEPGPAMALMLRLGAERGLLPVSPSSRP